MYEEHARDCFKGRVFMTGSVENTYHTAYGVIHYWTSRKEANKQWLVMLPGLTADHHLFDKQIEGLKDKYNCFVWDAPAHGLSRPFALKFSMFDMAQYLYDILAKEEIVRPIFIGQSLGGYIAQIYMEMFPEAISGFVSIDSCPLKRKYYTGLEISLLKRTKGMYLSIPWKLLIKWGSVGTAKTEYGRRLMKETMETYEKEEYCELADHGYRILAEAVEAEKSYNITCPVVLLCGEKDNAGSAKSYNRRWTKQEGYKLIWLKDAGHNSNTDVPEQVNQIIDDFVVHIL